jgi:hypothetical protein
MPEDHHDRLRAALAGGGEAPLLQLVGPRDTYLLTGELQRDPMLQLWLSGLVIENPYHLEALSGG